MSPSHWKRPCRPAGKFFLGGIPSDRRYISLRTMDDLWHGGRFVSRI